MSKQVNPYSNHYDDQPNASQSMDIEHYAKAQAEIHNRLMQIAGISENEKYQQQKAYQQQEDKYSRFVNQYERQNGIDIQSQFERIGEALRNRKKPKQPTRTELMDKIILSISEIQRLTDALSLSISSPEDRESFDIIVRNWIEDRIKQLEKEY